MISEGLEEITQSVQKEFGMFDTQVLNMKPAEDKWSIAQVLDHLTVAFTIKTGDAMNIIVEHERRHLRQAERVKETIQGNKAA